MATPWYIRVRVDLHTDARVLRMAEELGRMGSIPVVEPEAPPLSRKGVSRDVTIGGLLRVWSHACAHTARGVFQHVTGLEYLGILAGIDGFGRAMAVVGWASFDADSQSLELPNFLKWNTPAKSGKRGGRPGNPESAAAVRKRKQRQKKLEGQSCDNSVTTLGQQAGQPPTGKGTGTSEDERVRRTAESICAAYPRKDAPLDVLTFVTQDLAAGQDGDQMLHAVERIAAKIQAAPSGSANRFVPSALSFFRERQWRSPEAFDHRWSKSPKGTKGNAVVLSTPTKSGW
jgi:hypothetical protein